MDSSLSASSRISTSKDFTAVDKAQSFFCKRSLSRPGVETKIFEPLELISSVAENEHQNARRESSLLNTTVKCVCVKQR